MIKVTIQGENLFEVAEQAMTLYQTITEGSTQLEWKAQEKDSSVKTPPTAQSEKHKDKETSPPKKRRGRPRKKKETTPEQHEKEIEVAAEKTKKVLKQIKKQVEEPTSTIGLNKVKDESQLSFEDLGKPETDLLGECIFVVFN